MAVSQFHLIFIHFWEAQKPNKTFLPTREDLWKCQAASPMTDQFLSRLVWACLSVCLKELLPVLLLRCPWHINLPQKCHVAFKFLRKYFSPKIMTMLHLLLRSPYGGSILSKLVQTCPNLSGLSGLVRTCPKCRTSPKQSLLSHCGLETHIISRVKENLHNVPLLAKLCYALLWWKGCSKVNVSQCLHFWISPILYRFWNWLASWRHCAVPL